MDAPLKIDEELYFETKFDTEALISMMMKKVLEYVGYDYSGIVIQYTAREPLIIGSHLITQHEDMEELSETDNIGQDSKLMQGM